MSNYESIKQKIAQIDLKKVTDEMHVKGFSILPGLLTDKQCEELKEQYGNDELFRKKVVMERYRFGLGEYKYYNYPLPDLIQEIRETIYPKLAPIANSWMRVLKVATTFPDTLLELQMLCHSKDQLKPTALILKYGKGGYNTLHQDLYGDIFFPIQAVLFLNEPDVDYSGGEFVLTQQTPRAQSKVVVLKPKKGEILIFTTNFRPVKGNKGYYRVNMKHGVSEIHTGERHTLGIIFHDAVS